MHPILLGLAAVAAPSLARQFTGDNAALRDHFAWHVAQFSQANARFTQAAANSSAHGAAHALGAAKAHIDTMRQLYSALPMQHRAQAAIAIKQAQTIYASSQTHFSGRFLRGAPVAPKLHVVDTGAPAR